MQCYVDLAAVDGIEENEATTTASTVVSTCIASVDGGNAHDVHRIACTCYRDDAMLLSSSLLAHPL